MLKKTLLFVIAFFLASGLALAEVDVNKADQAALDGVRGIGPSLSKRILEERQKGPFKEWADLEKRVKGIKDKSAARLSAAGLTVNGQSRPGAAAAPVGKEGKDGKDAKEGKPARGEAKAKPSKGEEAMPGK